MNRGNSDQFYYSLRFHDKANCNDTFKTCKKQKAIFLCRDIIKISVGISCRNSVNSLKQSMNASSFRPAFQRQSSEIRKHNLHVSCLYCILRLLLIISRNCQIKLHVHSSILNFYLIFFFFYS